MGGPISICCCEAPTGGFKLITAMVKWMGSNGFDQRDSEGNCSDADIAAWTADPCPGSVCNSYTPYSPHPRSWKYLQYDLLITWNERSDRIVAYPESCDEDASFEEHSELHFRRTYSSVTNRFSGVTTESDDVEWHTTSTGADPVDLTGTEAMTAFYARTPPYGGVAAGYSLEALCGNPLQPEPFPGSGYTLVGPIEITDNSITIVCEYDYESHTTPPCTNHEGSFGTDDTEASGTFTVNVILSDKFTSQEVYELAKGLLALWDLSDDTTYPWRTGCSGLSYNLGALVTYDYNGYGPAGDGSILGGSYPGETWLTGAHAWTGYSPEGMAGAAVSYVQGANTYDWLPGSLIVSKWAEKKVALPAHNYARPCGEDYWATTSEIHPDYWSVAIPPIDPAEPLCWDPGSPTGKLTTNGTNVSNGDTVTIGSKAYQFVTALTPVEGEVLIGANANSSMTHLKDAINHTGTPGTDYSAAAAHPEVSGAFSTPVLTVTSLITATEYGHFYATTTTAATLTWAHAKLIGPECANPCNNTTTTGDYTTEERQYDYRGFGEAGRINLFPTVCPLAEGATDPGTPCIDGGGLYPMTVPTLWVTDCTQADATAGTVLCCSPTNDFGTGDYYPFPASLDADAVEGMCDDTYGYLWHFHIRQVMPDPLITCLGLYPFNAVAAPEAPTRLTPVLLEEARCTEGSCPALPATPATPIFFCPDSEAQEASECGFQDDYGLQCPPL